MDAKNYQPSTLSNLSNIFERIIHQQVCLFFEDTPSEHQFG